MMRVNLKTVLTTMLRMLVHDTLFDHFYLLSQTFLIVFQLGGLLRIPRATKAEMSDHLLLYKLR